MSSAFHAFMEDAIDYAGLFPPARLPLDQAVRDYLRHRDSQESWMLGRFIVPAARLRDLQAHASEIGKGVKAFRLTVLVGGGDTEREALDRIRGEVREIAAFHERDAGRAAVEILETRLPPELVEAASARRARAFLGEFRSVVAGAGLAGIPAFFEAAATGAWRETDGAAIAGIEEAGAGDRSCRVGFKLRCGGPEARDVPPAERVAFVIGGCRDRSVPLKCTAGLHHPMRWDDPVSGSRGHGFLGVLGAGILAAARRLPLRRIEECVGDDSPASFRFEDGSFAWREERAASAEVERVRRETMVGFGSCSFDEPRDDLRTLGLLG